MARNVSDEVIESAVLDDSARTSLKYLFEPRHVAVIGASRTPGKLGYVVMRHLIDGGFAGRIFPVNPGGGEIEGFACARSAAELPEAADCAILVVPAAAAIDAIRDCAQRGVRAAIVAASGFAEAGTAEGRRVQDDMAAAARAAGMRLLGPNTNGIYNKSASLSLGYNSAHGYPMPLGPVSIIAHSGAVFAGLARTMMSLDVGLAKFVPVGNEADVDMLDVLDYCIEDDDTKVIGLAIEALSSGERLHELAARAHARGKPIVALKIGRSPAGVGAALAHSSRLAGSARAYDALFAACGIAGVRSVEGLAGGCALLAKRPQAALKTDRRLICVTTSGAGGAVLADLAADCGLDLAGTGGDWQGRAGEAVKRIPARGIVRNPIDVGAFAGDWSELGRYFAALEEGGLNGPTAVYAHIAPTPEMDRQLLGALGQRLDRTGSPIVVVAPGGLSAELERDYIARGIPVFHETTLCLESLRCHFATLDGPAPRFNPAEQRRETQAAVARLRASSPTGGMLDERQSAEVLRPLGIPLVESRVVTLAERARLADGFTRYPGVLKALAPGVAHRHQRGLVITGIADAAALNRAYEELAHRLQAQGFGEDVAVLLQPMIPSTWELIVGVSRQARLGHFLIVGLGGVQAELIDEVVLFPVGLAAEAIRARLAASRIGRLLGEKPNGRSATPIEQLVAILVGLQRLTTAAGNEIESIDLNPVLVTPANDLVAVDALIALPSASQTSLA